MSDSKWVPRVFVLQCIECNSIVADSSHLTARDPLNHDDDDDDDFRVRQLCHVRAVVTKDEKRGKSPTAKRNLAAELACAECDSVVGRAAAREGELASLNRVSVRRIEMSSQRGAARRVPTESLERAVRAQQRQAKVKLLELSKKAAALDSRIATLDAQAAILRRRRDQTDDDNDSAAD